MINRPSFHGKLTNKGKNGKLVEKPEEQSRGDLESRMWYILNLPPPVRSPLLNLLLGTRDAQRLLSFCSLFLATAIKRRSLNEQSSILW